MFNTYSQTLRRYSNALNARAQRRNEHGIRVATASQHENTHGKHGRTDAEQQQPQRKANVMRRLTRNWQSAEQVSQVSFAPVYAHERVSAREYLSVRLCVC